MKTLLTTCLLCLLATGVEAGEKLKVLTDEPPSHFALTKKELAELARTLKEYENVELRVKLIDDACLAKMEAAMRAMEPFIPHDHGTFMEQLTLKNLEPFKAASKQWEAVKKECWNKP